MVFWNTFLSRDPNSFTKIFFLSALKISDPKYVNLPSVLDPKYFFFQSSKFQTPNMFTFPKFQTPNMYMITPVIKVNEFPPGNSYHCRYQKQTNNNAEPKQDNQTSKTAHTFSLTFTFTFAYFSLLLFHFPTKFYGAPISCLQIFSVVP